MSAYPAKLTEEQLATALPTIPNWTRQDEKWIVRKYKFADFLAAMKFVNQVADIAEDVQHHPFISIDYKVVALKMSSWQAGGLTQLDIDTASKFDRLYEKEPAH